MEFIKSNGSSTIPSITPSTPSVQPTVEQSVKRVEVEVVEPVGSVGSDEQYDEGQGERLEQENKAYSRNKRKIGHEVKFCYKLSVYAGLNFA